ncbi:hypothetical protein R1sor_026091 [Riccia sorocarpa]|uniref:Threonylcarbamoyl-AMP synthase n=1 Tax=Riccia sorocarpa TaxID=122646 RepID=A0ABD3GAF9_9MARC
MWSSFPAESCSEYSRSSQLRSGCKSLCALSRLSASWRPLVRPEQLIGSPTTVVHSSTQSATRYSDQLPHLSFIRRRIPARSRIRRDRFGLICGWEFDCFAVISFSMAISAPAPLPVCVSAKATVSKKLRSFTGLRNSSFPPTSGSHGPFFTGGCNVADWERRGGQFVVKNESRIAGAAQATVKRSPKRLKYASGVNRKGSNVVYVEVGPSGSDDWKLESVVELIKGGAVGVIPTDTVYAIVCDLKNRAAIERLYRIKNMDAKKPLSILCRSFQDIDTYTLGFPRGNSHGQTNVFRAARQCFPGPYTFILPASKEMPKQCTNFGGSAAASYAPRKSVGVRMPDDEICKAILAKLDEPLVCTSVRRPSDDVWMLDPVIIADTYGGSDVKEGLDFVVDGGVRVADPSTVVDMTTSIPTLLRRGKGLVEDWMLMEVHDSSEAVTQGGRANPYA